MGKAAERDGIQVTTPIPEPEQVFNVAYPFVIDPEREAEFKWKPGIRMELRGNTQFHVEDMLADAIGQQILTVVAVFKPGKYPTRVFFTRKWRDPSGKVFGKNALRITSLTAFMALTRGYRHEFELSVRK